MAIPPSGEEEKHRGMAKTCLKRTRGGRPQGTQLVDAFVRPDLVNSSYPCDCHLVIAWKAVGVRLRTQAAAAPYSTSRISPHD